ncbi:MAG: segregation/condensation protein A [Clostridia bacterium]|nr:segregation/condensation protein A [Clostridia bacterium]
MTNEVTFHLEVFDGPLDLLLHLISKNKVEITDIPIAEILRQYLEYLQKMQEFDMEIASEFITMAAQLMHIKSKMLLPVYDDEEQEDPIAQLVEMLLEYQRFKELGSYFSEQSEAGRDIYVREQEPLEKDYSKIVYSNTADDLLKAIGNILQRAERRMPPSVYAFKSIVGREPVPVNVKISQILSLFSKHKKISLNKLLLSSESRSEIVAYFLAVLELSKDGRVYLTSDDENYYLNLSTEAKNGV